MELYEGGVHRVQRLFETWIAAITEILTAARMETIVAQQQAIILAKGLNNIKIFKRVIGDLATELFLG